MSAPPNVTLRPVEDEDLPAFFSYLQDPEAQALTDSPIEDAVDEQAFDAYWHRLRNNPNALVRTITEDGENPVGHISVRPEEGTAVVRYWLDRSAWGRGIASAALALFLADLRERPVEARTSQVNEAARAVLKKNGFRVVGQETGFDAGRGRMVNDVILRLT